MLRVPNKTLKQQSWFALLSNGKTNTDLQIPIKSYKITHNKLTVIKYADGLPKDFDLTIFKNQPEKFII